MVCGYAVTLNEIRDLNKETMTQLIKVVLKTFLAGIRASGKGNQPHDWDDAVYDSLAEQVLAEQVLAEHRE